MKSSNTDTVIIGGGISGLACAHHLQQNNQDFILISKDIGGRIRISDDGEINYGAFFVCKDYYNILPYVTLKSRIYLRDFCFHNLDESYTLYSPELIGHVGDFIKIHWILRHFRRHLHTFRKKAETTSQKTIMENNPWLYRLYMMDACDFIHEQAIEHGTEKYLSYGLYSTTFSPVSEMNAFSFLEFLLPLITPI